MNSNCVHCKEWYIPPIQTEKKRKQIPEKNKQTSTSFFFFLSFTYNYHNIITVGYLFRCIEKFFIRSRFLGRYEPIQTDPNWHKLTYTPGANDGNQSKWQLSNLYKENDPKKISYTDDKTMKENDIIFSPKNRTITYWWLFILYLWQIHK